MSKQHEDDIKQYIILSEAWYGEANLKPPTHLNLKQYLKYIENVQFGFYSPDGGSSGEMAMNWYILSGEKPTPCLECWNAAFHALAQFKDVLDGLAELDDTDFTPRVFCRLLERCGFVDATPRECLSVQGEMQ